MEIENCKLKIDKAIKLIKDLPIYLNLTSNQGITFIEVLIVVTITAIIGASAISLSSNFLNSNNFKNKTNEIVSLLRFAQINSMAGKEDSSWGVKISENKITLYKGNSFETRESPFDSTYDIPQTVSITQGDYVFEKLTGNPDSTATITVQSNAGDSANISVNEIGIVDVN